MNLFSSLDCFVCTDTCQKSDYIKLFYRNIVMFCTSLKNNVRRNRLKALSREERGLVITARVLVQNFPLKNKLRPDPTLIYNKSIYDVFKMSLMFCHCIVPLTCSPGWKC